ncbi:hypothetical protein [Hymenobacter norwichensis]|nr:hypothetical protein [Hymenobacter norwichensis]
MTFFAKLTMLQIRSCRLIVGAYLLIVEADCLASNPAFTATGWQ